MHVLQTPENMYLPQAHGYGSWVWRVWG